MILPVNSNSDTVDSQYDPDYSSPMAVSTPPSDNQSSRGNSRAEHLSRTNRNRTSRSSDLEVCTDQPRLLNFRRNTFQMNSSHVSSRPPIDPSRPSTIRFQPSTSQDLPVHRQLSVQSNDFSQLNSLADSLRMEAHRLRIARQLISNSLVSQESTGNASPRSIRDDFAGNSNVPPFNETVNDHCESVDEENQSHTESSIQNNENLESITSQDGHITVPRSEPAIVATTEQERQMLGFMKNYKEILYGKIDHEYDESRTLESFYSVLNYKHDSDCELLYMDLNNDKKLKPENKEAKENLPILPIKSTYDNSDDSSVDFELPKFTNNRQPGLITNFMYNGSNFSGKQKSKDHSYDVYVRIQFVDYDESYLCGYLCIHNLTENHPSLTTFFEGEIISEKHPFLTKKWDASVRTDRDHWSKFEEFNTKYSRSLYDADFDYSLLKDSENIYMRWKEHFLVPDHTITDVEGASYDGFYYICHSKRNHSINGFYYHTDKKQERRVESFQSLHLELEETRSSQVYEFR